MTKLQTCELHLEGARAVALCHIGHGRPAPRAVMFTPEGADTPTVWQFYRYCTAKVSGNRAAYYRKLDPAQIIHLAPGVYNGS
jgi:hypothetical protein